MLRIDKYMRQREKDEPLKGKRKKMIIAMGSNQKKPTPTRTALA